MARGIAGLVFLLILLPSAQGQQVWRHVGEEGEVRYSDRPFAEAVPMQLPGPGRWSGQTAPARSIAEPSGPKAEEPVGTNITLAITRPSPGDTVWGDGGTLDVAVDISGLEEGGGRLVLELDGAEADWEGEPPLVRLKQVWRGEHRLRARLVDPKGKMLASSKEVRFYKRQPTVIKAAAVSGSEGVPPSAKAGRLRSQEGTLSLPELHRTSD